MYHGGGDSMDDVNVFFFGLSELSQFSTANVNCFCNNTGKLFFFFLRLDDKIGRNMKEERRNSGQGQ